MEQDQNIDLDEKIILSKSILKFIQEISDEGSGRIDMQMRIYSPMEFALFAIKVSFSCLGIVKYIDVQSGSP